MEQGIIFVGNNKNALNEIPVNEGRMGRITLIATITALISIAVYYIWFPTGWVMLSAYAGISLVAVIAAIAVYVLGGFAQQEQQAALIANEVAREQKLYDEVKLLNGQLSDLDMADAAKQATRLMNMLEDYRRVIEHKLGDTTITLSSYSSETSRVFRLAINNLKDILAASQSVNTIKSEEVDAKALESEALQRRQALLTGQNIRIEELVKQNRELLTVLNETTVQVANIQDTDSFELQEALSRLRDLGQRAQSFSK